MKTCSKCKLAKDLSEYNKRSDNSRFRSHCKPCVKQYNSRVALTKCEGKAPKLSIKVLKENRRLALKRYNANPLRKAKQANYEAKRRCIKLKATPKWLSKEQLKHIELHYHFAKALSLEFGEQFDVDHIIPLRGNLVNGLHVPWNLQIMSHAGNISKGNRCE